MVHNNDDAHYGLGLSVNTAKRVICVLSGAFNFAVGEKLLVANPVDMCRTPPIPLSSANPMTLEEAWTFISVKDFSWYGDAFAFNLQTGLRPQELMALIWDDIDFAAMKVRVERACKWIGGDFTGFGPPKTRRSRRDIELAPEHIEFLRARWEKQKQHVRNITQKGLAYGEPKVTEWLRRERSLQLHKYKYTDLIFPSKLGGVPNSDGPRQAFKRLLCHAGFKDDRLNMRWYDIRHTHATFLLTLGVPDHEVAARLGHTVGELNRTYAHILEGRQRTASTLFVNLIPLATGLSSPSDIDSRITQILRKSTQDLEEAMQKLLGKR
jgi:integrase